MALPGIRHPAAPLPGGGLLPQRLVRRAVRIHHVADDGKGCRPGRRESRAAVRHRELRGGEPLEGGGGERRPGADAAGAASVGGRVRRAELPPGAEEEDQAAIVPVAQAKIEPGVDPYLPMSEEKLDFLRRWSRLKRESSAAAPLEKVEPEKPVALPALDSLTFESDFKAFMRSKIEEGVKRAALKKLSPT